MKKFYLFFIVFCMYFSCSSVLYGQVDELQEKLNPGDIPQFVDPLPHFAGNRVDAKAGGNLMIKAVPHQQVAVSTGTVLSGNVVVGSDPGAGLGNYWVYQISKDGGANYTPPLWPAFTIEASRGKALNVTYINELGGQTYADVNLKLDQTLHWARIHQLGPSMTAYDGPIPIVPHLHGGEVPSESDGGPDAWFTPGYDITGPSWGLDGTDQFYYYPNTQEAATLWFHDHALGATRLNVYAGLAGFYFLRGNEEKIAKLPGWLGDDGVLEVAPDGTSGTFNPNPYLPEIEIVIQDRMFDTNGELYFPVEPTSPDDHPFWTPEFVGDVITVNGKTWPYLSVAPRKYRFRLLNGSNARFYNMWLEGGANAPAIIQIGTDGGLMDAPAVIDPNLGGKLLLAPGERADIVIDFSQSDPNQVWTLKNDANTPFPDGDLVEVGYTDRIMQFVVNGEMVKAQNSNAKAKGRDKSDVPATLRKPMVKLSDFAGGITVTPDKIRQLTLNEVGNDDDGLPLEALVNNTKWDATPEDDTNLGISELPVEGETELWQIINLTGDAHPIHLHLVQMQLVSRQSYNLEGVGGYFEAYESEFSSGEYEPAAGPPNVYTTPNGDGAIGGNPAISSFLTGDVHPPLPNERGWKDTYVMYPGEVTTFIVRYAPTDVPTDAPAKKLMFDFDPSAGPGYVWHCHIIDHEDNEMMRPYQVVPSPLRGLKSGEIFASKIVDTDLGFELEQNYPNPFNRETEIQFRLPESMHTRLTLYNQQGQVVKVLLNQVIPAGNNTVRLNKTGLVKGVYFYQLSAGGNVTSKKLVVN